MTMNMGTVHCTRRNGIVAGADKLSVELQPLFPDPIDHLVRGVARHPLGFDIARS